ALLLGLIVRGLSWWWLRRAVFCGVPSLEDAVHQNRMVALLTGGFPEAALPWGSPLYPYLAAGVTALFGLDLSGLLLAQGLIGLAALPLIAWALRPLLSPRGCWIAALIYGLHPLGAFFEMRLQPMALFVLLLLLVLRLLFLERRGAAGQMLGGLLLGLAFLLQPLPAFALAAAFFWHRLATIGRWRRRATAPTGSRASTSDPSGASASRASAPRTPDAAAVRGGEGRGGWMPLLPIAGAMALLPLLLILYHASLPQGGPTWNVSDAAAFHRSLGPETWGAARATQPPVWQDPGQLAAQANEALGRRLGEWELASFYRDRALQRLLENPVQVVGSLLHRAALLLSRPELPDPVSARHVFQVHAPAFRWGLHLFPLFLALGFLGLWMRRDDPEMRRLWPPLLALAIANLVGTYSAASRWPFFLLLLPAVSTALLTVPALLAAVRRTSSARIVVGIAAALLVLSSLDLPAAHSRYENESEDLRYRAAVALRLQDERTATALLQRALREDPRNTVAHIDLGELYAAEDLRDAARGEYETALEQDPENPRALYNMSEILRSEERYAPAESLAARLVREHPQHPLYLNQYGVIKMVQGQFSDARFLFRRALSIAPDYQVAQMNLRTLDEAERKAPTLAFPEEMIPPRDSPLLALGFAALQALGESDWARADSLTTVAVDSFPELPLAWYLRGGFYYRAERYAEAIPYLVRVVETAPGRALTTQLAARALLAAGEPQRAIALTEESLAQASDPRNRESIERLLDTLRRESSAGP
ncbi:MAG: tetratricopeptide repeat protein, partial [Candidatus Eisenbacteria bacterium]|nr:tetratricopeptide repeat protein [Candidatus Eisenbacteria bacterium]